MKLSQMRQRSAAPSLDDESHISGDEPMLMRDPKRGFRSAGEFYQAVRGAHGGRSTRTDERLRIMAAAPTTFGSERGGADGGFAVPPDFAKSVSQLLMEMSLLPLFDIMRTDSNVAFFPIDYSTPWGTSGVVASWQQEGGALTQIKPSMASQTLRLNKLLAFVPVSEETMEDAALLGDYLTGAAGEACAWKASDAVVKGLGNGTPSGVLNSAAVLVQAKDSGQATATISATNVSGMVGKLLPGSLGRAVWLVDSTVVPALLGLAGTNFPMTFAAGDDFVNGTQIPSLGRLAGRPVVVTQHMNAFSTQGDIALIDPHAYRVLLKNAPNFGMDVDVSLDVFFDAYAGAYRFRFRCDGAAKYDTPITTAKGGTASPYVTLAAR